MKLKKVLLLTIALQFSSFVLASNLQEQLINATNSLAVAQQTLVNLLPSPPANPNGSDGTPGENSQITYSAPLLSKVIADKTANDKAAIAQATADKIIADQAAAPSLSKAIADKTANDNAAIAQAAADKTAADKIIADEAAASLLEKAIADKTANDKAAAQAAADKAALEQLSANQKLARTIINGSTETISVAMLGANGNRVAPTNATLAKNASGAMALGTASIQVFDSKNKTAIIAPIDTTTTNTTYTIGNDSRGWYVQTNAVMDPAVLAAARAKAIADKFADEDSLAAAQINARAIAIKDKFADDSKSTNDLPAAQAAARAQAVADKYTEENSIAAALVNARAVAVADKFADDSKSTNGLPTAQVAARAKAIADKFTDDNSIASAQINARAVAVKDKRTDDQDSKKDLPVAQVAARAQAITDKFADPANRKTILDFSEDHSNGTNDSYQITTDGKVFLVKSTSNKGKVYSNASSDTVSLTLTYKNSAFTKNLKKNEKYTATEEVKNISIVQVVK